MQKARVTQIISPYDSITFSRDFIDDVDNLINTFNDVSKNKLFVDSLVRPVARPQDAFVSNKDWLDHTTINRSNLDLVGDYYPQWFLKLNIASIAQWIVSHFEVRIFK